MTRWLVSSATGALENRSASVLAVRMDLFHALCLVSASESRLMLTEQRRFPHFFSLDWSFDFAASKIFFSVSLFTPEVLVASQNMDIKRPRMNRMTPIIKPAWANKKPPPTKANAMVRTEDVSRGFVMLISALTASKARLTSFWWACVWDAEIKPSTEPMTIPPQQKLNAASRSTLELDVPSMLITARIGPPNKKMTAM